MLNRESGVYRTTYQADMAFFRVPLARWTVAIILAVVLIMPYFTTMFYPDTTEYWLRAIILPFMIFTIAVIGLNLLTGYCGQISLGHAAFTMMGGYTATILSIYGVPFLICVIAGGLGAALIGLLFLQ